MGPQTKPVERRSQATPFAEEFLKQLMGELTQSKGAQTTGPMQRTGVGSGPQQTFTSRLGGVDTASGVADHSTQLIDALQSRSQATSQRNAAELREGFSLMGNRVGSSLARGEALQRSEEKLNLDQLIAQVLTDQGARKTQASQFDAAQNAQITQMFAGLAGLGIIPEELIVSPGIGSQLLSAAANIGSAYVSGGGSLFGGGGGQQNPFQGGPPQFQLPNPQDPFNRDPFNQRGPRNV